MGPQPAELRESVILRHSAKQNLVNSIVDNTTLFLSKLSMELDPEATSLSEVVPQGMRYSNDSELRIRLEFLTYVIHNTTFQLAISTDDIEHMWNIFVKMSPAF
jgi:hypothetical protein